jgi:hypothetical protein
LVIFRKYAKNGEIYITHHTVVATVNHREGFVRVMWIKPDNLIDYRTIMAALSRLSGLNRVIYFAPSPDRATLIYKSFGGKVLEPEFDRDTHQLVYPVLLPGE